MLIYIYPKLPSNYDFFLFRVGGAGLANCMFIAARAYIKASKLSVQYINPSWAKFSIGPILRGERDKRHYYKIFESKGVSGIRKLIVLWKYFLIRQKRSEFLIEEGLGRYFKDLNGYEGLVRNYFESITPSDIKEIIKNESFENKIAVHVRLGDYPDIWRTEIAWYKEVIEDINKLRINKYKFYLFSDGEDAELEELLDLYNVERRFYGNALADLWAISECNVIIGSDSTFSGWAVFLGQKPCIFAHKHYGSILIDTNQEIISEGSSDRIEWLNNYV